MKTPYVLLASLLPLLALGCDEQPPPGAHVDSFRVLAEQAPKQHDNGIILAAIARHIRERRAR